jgi:hypothetical protein
MSTTRALAEAQLKQDLMQISLELDAAALAARQTSDHFSAPAQAWVDIQQLMTRFDDAAHRMGEFRRHIDELVRDATDEDQARLANLSRV